MTSAILTREQVRAFDAHAIDQAVPGLLLMENAGRGACDRLRARWSNAARHVVICGLGNNGGDGFVVARQLLARGCDVRTFVVGAIDRIGGDARINADALLGIGGEVTELDEDLEPLQAAFASADLLIDALLGTGLSRPIDGRLAEVVQLINASGKDCVALDLPSGIDANDGQILGVAVRAQHTLTFAALKCGLLQGPAVTHAGFVEVVGLGVPAAPVLAAVGQCARTIVPAEVAALVGHRAQDGHKYDAGSVLVLAGSKGSGGAALLCARAGLRSGAGLLTLASWSDVLPSLDGRLAEAMTRAIPDGPLDPWLAQVLLKKAAVAVGPGFGLHAAARALCERLVATWDGPLVLDADAISHFAGRPEALAAAPGSCILTPHAGELGRLLDCSGQQIEADRFAAVAEAAQRTGQVVLLKGHRSIVAGGGELPAVCLGGNSVLATAGSGDVLSGILAALAAAEVRRGWTPTSARRVAEAGCWLHARAGDRWRERMQVDRGMLASDLADEIPATLAEMQALGAEAARFRPTKQRPA